MDRTGGSLVCILPVHKQQGIEIYNPLLQIQTTLILCLNDEREDTLTTTGAIYNKGIPKSICDPFQNKLTPREN